MNCVPTTTTEQSKHLGTPRLITDSQQNPVWLWDTFEPFGNNPPDEDPGNTGTPFVFNLGLSGYYRDKETGTWYAYLRDCYDPQTGRFCQSDPIGLAGGINPYVYVENAPTMYTDPTGLAPAIRIPGMPLPIPLPGGNSGGTSGSGGTGNPDLDAGLGGR